MGEEREMKRVGGIFDEMVSFENLLLASRKARRGKRFKPKTSVFEFNLERELLRLQEELRDGSYCPGRYNQFYVYDLQKRLISAAPYRDRVVHHAVCNLIAPIFNSALIYDCYANRKDKGTHKALDRFTKFARRNRYALKCDIKKYFHSVDHEILLNQLGRKIKDQRILRLLSLIIRHSPPQEPQNDYFPGDDLFTPYQRRRGIPMGNLTSQFFANIYLSGFDHFMKEELRCGDYLRYVDDFVVFSDDKRVLREVKSEMEKYLAGLRLKLHPKKCFVAPVAGGIQFLGFKVYPDHRLLRKESVIKFKKRMKHYQKLFKRGEITLEEITVSMRSWIAHASHGDTYRLRKQLFSRLIFSS